MTLPGLMSEMQVSSMLYRLRQPLTTIPTGTFDVDVFGKPVYPTFE